MYDNIEPRKCTPPGTFHVELPHPDGSNRTIEKAVIMEHRFAFFFWMKWANQLQADGYLKQEAPTLVTIDWHRDLAPPTDEMKESLTKLDQSNHSDAVNFVWAQFDQTNDGHILCAAWINLIGDIILLQNTTGSQQSSFTDLHGNEHRVYEIKEFEAFQKFITGRNDQNIFFDVDLDYFIHGKGKHHYSEEFHRYSDEEIKDVINLENLAFQHMLPNIDGLTFALEPGYCGGITNSCKIMDLLNSQLFNQQNKWRHLTSGC